MGLEFPKIRGTLSWGPYNQDSFYPTEGIRRSKSSNADSCYVQVFTTVVTTAENKVARRIVAVSSKAALSLVVEDQVGRKT